VTTTSAANPNQRFDDRKRCRQKVLDALIKAAAVRNEGWVEHEREVMAEAANAFALAHGYHTITVEDIERIEHNAMGHCDYGSKIALYISELVVPSLHVR
jgi:hypothetical protein